MLKIGPTSTENIIDYVAGEREPFSSRAFTAVDSLVLSQLSYLHFDGIVPDSVHGAPVTIEEIAGRGTPDTLFRDVRDGESNRKLFAALAQSPRFQKTGLTFYVNRLNFEEEKQFSAVTCLPGDGTVYAAYRGTDSTFVGWKEDFNMAFLTPVPSQQEGAAYLNLAGREFSCGIRVGGHSKGGNIAVYSSAACEPDVQERIIEVFSHDGPGFREEFLQSPEYARIRGRIHKTLPQSAMVGMLLQHSETYTVVKSNRIGLMQHDPFSWAVENGDFVSMGAVNNSAMFMDETLNLWADSLDDRKRETFINTLYEVIKATDAKTIYDLTDHWQEKAAAALGAVREMDEETRYFVLQTIGLLFRLAVRNLRATRK
jgi:hypothetical protein